MVNNPYLESPPPEAFVPVEVEVGRGDVQPMDDRDPLLLSPKRRTAAAAPKVTTTTAPPAPKAKSPAPTTARPRPKAQPRARSSATPAAPGPNPKRKPKDGKSPAAAPEPTTTAESTDPPAVVVRDEYCSFCSGTDAKNKAGFPERMLTCEKCGRSGTSASLSWRG